MVFLIKLSAAAALEIIRSFNELTFILLGQISILLKLAHVVIVGVGGEVALEHLQQIVKLHLVFLNLIRFEYGQLHGRSQFFNILIIRCPA